MTYDLRSRRYKGRRMAFQAQGGCILIKKSSLLKSDAAKSLQSFPKVSVLKSFL